MAVTDIQRKLIALRFESSKNQLFAENDKGLFVSVCLEEVINEGSSKNECNDFVQQSYCNFFLQIFFSCLILGSTPSNETNC